MAVSNDGTLLVTFSSDQSMKIFDVVNFDMMHMLQLPFVPAAAEWVYRVRGHAPCYLQDPHMQTMAYSVRTERRRSALAVPIMLMSIADECCKR